MRSVSGLLRRLCSDIAQPSYLISTLGIPDLHKGDRSPIGCAIVTEDPAPIGSDIGCGIALNPLGRIQTPEPRLYNPNFDGSWGGSPPTHRIQQEKFLIAKPANGSDFARERCTYWVSCSELFLRAVTKFPSLLLI